MKFQPEWNEFLALLARHGVRFVMVGGLAVAAHGRERYTKDLDILVDTSEVNAQRLGRVLAEFGFAAAARAWRRFTEPYSILTLGREPVRIDVLTSISGVSFAQVWKGRIQVSTNAGVLPIIGLRELRLNKLASGRPEDLRDVELLASVKRAPRAVRSRRKVRRMRSR